MAESQFGGVAVEDEAPAVSQFGGVSVDNAPTTEEPKNIPGTNVDYSAPGFVAGTVGVVGGAMLGPGLKSEFDKYGIPGLKPQAATAPQVPPTFKSPTDVAAQAIKNRQGSVTVEGYPSNPNANYGRSQFVNPEGKGLFYGTGETGDYSGVRKSAEEAIAAEKQFPGMKSIQGGATPFSVPEHVAKELESLKIQEDAARNAHNQAEVSRIAHLRASRLQAVENAYKELNAKPGFMESLRGAPVQAARRGVENVGDFLNRTISPHGMATAGSRALGALGGLDVGLQGTNAVEHAMKGQYGRAAVSGLGALGGAAALTRHPLLMPIGMGVAAGAPYLNEYLDTLAEKHPGLHLADGGSVPEMGTAQAYEPSYSEKIRDYAAKYMSPQQADTLFGGPRATTADKFNPIGMALQTPGAIADSAKGFVEAGQKGDYLGGMGNYLMGAMNVAPMLKPAGQVGRAALKELGPKAADMAENYLAKLGGVHYAVPNETKFMRASEAYAPQEGKTLNLTQSDRLKAIEGELGGHEFSGHQIDKPEYKEENAVWGVASPQEATKIINRNKKVPEGQSIWAPLIGSETQHQTNPHVFDPMLEEFYHQVRTGNLTPETAAKMKAALGKQEFGSGARKGQLMFPNTPDVTNEEAIRNLSGTFENRGPLANVLFGAQGAGKTKGQIIDYKGMLQDMADPKSIGAPTHSVGTRIFTLDNNASYRPDLHSAFPHILSGTDMGVSHAPVPKELILGDYMQQYRDFTGKEPGTWAFTRKPLSVQMTDKLLRKMEAAGHKKGGKVKKDKK